MKRKQLIAADREPAGPRMAGKRSRKLVAAALVSSLVLGMGAAPAWAYFTDTHWADGGLPIKGQPDTEIHEWYAKATKHVTVSNTGDDDVPMFVRAKVEASEALSYTAAGEGWTTEPDAGGWYYYTTRLESNTETSELTVQVTFPTVKSEEQPDGAIYGDNYSAVVLYEAVPAVYDKDGKAVVLDAEGNAKADWTYLIDRPKGEEGGN